MTDNTKTTEKLANSRKSRTNNKTFTLTLRFFTDKIADAEGEILPMHMWDSGKVEVRVSGNERHGITSDMRGTVFNGLQDVERAVRKTLSKLNAVVHIDK
jgi:hypothetical protein